MSLLALERDATGPVNIGTGIETDVNELAALLLEVSGSRSEVRHGPAKAGEQRRSVVEIRRAAEVFGWKPEVSCATGSRARWSSSGRARPGSSPGGPRSHSAKPARSIALVTSDRRASRPWRQRSGCRLA